MLNLKQNCKRIIKRIVLIHSIRTNRSLLATSHASWHQPAPSEGNETQHRMSKGIPQCKKLVLIAEKGKFFGYFQLAQNYILIKFLWRASKKKKISYKFWIGWGKKTKEKWLPIVCYSSPKSLQWPSSALHLQKGEQFTLYTYWACQHAILLY